MLQLDNPNRTEAVIRTLAVGADHVGYQLKELLKVYLNKQNIAVIDVGVNSEEAADYPDYAHAVARAVEQRQAGAGMLICGTGIGMSIAANRHAGVRAILCPTVEHARLGRTHNNGNIICLGARITPVDEAKKILDVFLTASFEGGRHEQRLAKVTP